MYNTIGGFALMKIEQETNDFYDFVQYPKQKLFAFVLSVFFFLNHVLEFWAR